MSLIEGLQKYYVTPFVINPQKSYFTEALETKKIQFEILPIPWWVSNKQLSFKKKWEAWQSMVFSSREIRRIAEKWNIDLIYTNSSVTPIGRMAARSARLPHAWHIREFGDLDFSFQYIFPRFLCKSYIRSSEAVICHAQVVREHHFPRGKSNIHQVYNGVATRPEFNARLEQREKSNHQHPFTFVMLSAITPKKGQETAIRAIGALRQRGINAKLLIAGSGKSDYLDHLRLIVQELDAADAVEFSGFLADPFPLYFASDCALICSEHEALSRVGLEAMSTALPLIGRNSGGNPEVIDDGKTGFLYATFDELVDYMEKLVRDPQLGKRMGLAGWQRAKEKFNIEDYAANVYRVIQSVMK